MSFESQTPNEDVACKLDIKFELCSIMVYIRIECKATVSWNPYKGKDDDIF